MIAKYKTLIAFLSFFVVALASISAPVVYVVGPSAGATHATILAAYTACNTAANTYTIQIQTTYVATVEASLPVVFGVRTNSGVLIEPLGALTITGTTGAQLFSFTNGDNITIDGRVAGAGAGVLTLSNTFASGTACIRFADDASNNTIKYCTLMSTSAATLGGVYFSNSATGTTGCDNNTIDNCTIRAGASKPAYGIRADGVSLTEGHDNLTISNCNIVDFTISGIWLEDFGTGWTITGNSFYQSASQTPTSNMYGINLDDGSNHTVTGNFFGGQAAGCGVPANPYTLAASAFYFSAIYFSTNITAGTCTIAGNTIKNFNVSTTGGSTYSFMGIFCDGLADYNIGVGLAGNAIGDSVSGTGSIIITATGAQTAIFRGIRVVSDGTNNVKYNGMGAVTINGSATGSTLSRFIEVTADAGSTNIEYNKIGNATAANISLPVTTNVYDFDGIYTASNANATISNNTVQNVSSLGATAPQGSGITVTGSGLYAVNNNSVINSVFSCSLYAIDVTSTYAGVGTNTVNGNTIKNLSIATATTYCFMGIRCGGSADFQIGATGAGSGNCIGDTVSGTGNITITASGTPGNIFRGIYSSSTGTHSIRCNAIGAITCTGTATAAASCRFIEVTASSAATIGRNTIGNPGTSANISFPLAARLYDFHGIVCAAGASAVDYNIIQNISNLGTGAAQNSGITVTGSGLSSVSYNSVINSVFSSHTYAMDITSTLAGSCSVNGNIIKSLTISSTYASASYSFLGIRCAGSANYIVGVAGAGNGNAIGDTISGTGNITITASGAQTNIFRGIRIYSTGTNTVKYNAMGSITCTGTATGTPVNRFIEVAASNGFNPIGSTTIQYNTIGNPATLANISFPVAGNLYGFGGIVYESNENGNISYNKFQNISNLGTGDVGENECIKVTGDGTYTVSYNTVGNTTANNIVYASNMLMHGIWFTNTTGTFTVTGNYVQNFNCTSTGANTYYHGQCIDGGGSINFTQDTVRNISIAGTNTSSPDCLVQGLRVINNSANQVIDKCMVKDITATSTTASITMIGIYTGPTGSCTGNLTRCHISGLVVASNGATAKNYGMYLAASGSWNAYNNVVLLDNGGNYSPTIGGIVSASTGASTLNIFHNSVKIYGTGGNSAADMHSMAYYRVSAGASSITDVKNNVWQNLRTGGTGNHYACRIGITSNLTCDYNYLENTVASTFAYSGGDIGSLAAWNALGYVGTDKTGTVTLENVKGFSNNAPIPNGGIAPLTPAITEDKEAYGRANPNPWIGAWENLPASLPVEMLGFKASCKEGEVDLKWTTATETNNHYFSIERGTNGKDFQFIGKVYGAGNSSFARNYEFVDEALQVPGEEGQEGWFYRIRQVDYDGQFEYFGPVSVRCNSSGIEINPTVSEGVFFITGDISNAEISVCSVIGEAVYFGDRQSFSSVIDLSEQASGIYFVKIRTKQGLEVKKIAVKH